MMFLMSWFLIGLWPLMKAAFLLGPGGGRLPVSETFVYLPIIPLAAIVVLALRRLFESSKQSHLPGRSIITLAGVGFIALFFLLTYKNAGQAYDEVTLLEEAQTLEPPNAQLHYSLGLLYAHKENPAQAQYHFAQAVAINPDLLEARLGLGKAFYAQGHFLDAAKVYESIQNAGKYQNTVDNNLKATYSILTLSQEAVVSKNPSDINAYFSLGVFYGKLGDLSKAIDSYQRVIDLDPGNTAGLRTLALKFQGMLYQETGNPAKAQENFERTRL
jgi:tetratricopeptide (TPR) repeat protein